MIVSGRHFQPSLIFAGKARSLPKSGAFCKDLALPAYIRIGRKSLPETNTLAYYEHSDLKSSRALTTYICVIKTFSSLRVGQNKLERLSLAILSCSYHVC